MSQPPWPPPAAPYPPSPPNRPGPGTTALVLGAIGLFLAGLAVGGVLTALVALTDEDDGPASPSTSSGERVAIDQLEVGQCFHDPDADDRAEEGSAPRSVRVVPCGIHHDAEVFHTYELEETRWPGDEKLDKAVERACDAQFERYVGEPYDESPYASWWYTPSKGTFEDDDRLVICIVSPPVGEVDHSAKGDTHGHGEGA